MIVRTETASQKVVRQRTRVLVQLVAATDGPLVILSGAWLVLLILELTRGLEPVLQRIGLTIWVIFVMDFFVKFVIAPRKLTFLRRQWLTVLALALPAARVFRITRFLRAARAARGLRLARVLAGLNRGMRTLRHTLRRRGFGYVAVVTVMVALIGAAGMFAFENPQAGGALDSYGEALWWTAMLLSTMGSQYWPITPEGRVLCLVLSLYGFAMLGYVTAALASVFIGQDASRGAPVK